MPYWTCGYTPQVLKGAACVNMSQGLKEVTCADTPQVLPPDEAGFAFIDELRVGVAG